MSPVSIFDCVLPLVIARCALLAPQATKAVVIAWRANFFLQQESEDAAR